MDKISDLLPEAVSMLTTPIKAPPVAIESEAWDWKWALVGNETPDEKASLLSALASARRFVSDMATGQPPRWLTLVGVSGSGKTHLLEQIRDFVKSHGREIYNRNERNDLSDPSKLFSYAQEAPMLCKWGTLIESMRDGEFGRYKTACSDWFKAIDDLGVDSFDREGAATKFAVQKMAELLDRRLRKWTVITSNFTRKQLADTFDVRIASRLIRDESEVVEIRCRDFNLRKELIRKAA